MLISDTMYYVQLATYNLMSSWLNPFKGKMHLMAECEIIDFMFFIFFSRKFGSSSVSL